MGIVSALKILAAEHQIEDRILKPHPEDVNSRLLKMLRHPSLMRPTTLAALANWYAETLPLTHGSDWVKRIAPYHIPILLHTLEYAFQKGYDDAAFYLAETIADSGKAAVEAAKLARRYNNKPVLQRIEEVVKARKEFFEDSIEADQASYRQPNRLARMGLYETALLQQMVLAVSRE